MRRLILWNVMTLDGCFEGTERWDLAFHHLVWGEEMQQFSLDQHATADLLLFGRVTYEGMAAYWPTEQAVAEHPAITEFMNGVQKIVFAGTRPTAEWQNTRLESGNAVEAVAALKREPGADILLFGSATLADALSRAGLIDEYRIAIAPVVLRAGTPLFKPDGPELRLELVSTQVLTTGGVILSYRPAGRVDGPDQAMADGAALQGA